MGRSRVGSEVAEGVAQALVERVGWVDGEIVAPGDHAGVAGETEVQFSHAVSHFEGDREMGLLYLIVLWKMY